MNEERKRKVKGMGGVYEREGFWYIRYAFRGETYRESSQSRLKSVARDLLKKRISEIQTGAFIPAARRTKLSDLLALTVADYKNNGKRTLNRLIGTDGKTGLHGHLTRLLGADTPADRLAEKVEGYKSKRLQEGAAGATVNRELSALRRAFRLGIKGKRVTAESIPVFDFLEEAKPRTGFPEPEQVEGIIEKIPDRLKGVVRFLSITGWRLGEALSLQWGNVDLKSGTLRLESEDTKGGEVRTYHYAEDPELEGIIEERKAERDSWDREHSTITPWVFWYEAKDGTAQPNELHWTSRKFREAAEDAKCGHITAHDLRRYVARNLIRTGTGQKLAQELLGHRTRSIFDRYNITDERDLKNAVRNYSQKRLAASKANEA